MIDERGQQIVQMVRQASLDCRVSFVCGLDAIAPGKLKQIKFYVKRICEDEFQSRKTFFGLGQKFLFNLKSFGRTRPANRGHLLNLTTFISRDYCIYSGFVQASFSLANLFSVNGLSNLNPLIFTLEGEYQIKLKEEEMGEEEPAEKEEPVEVEELIDNLQVEAGEDVSFNELETTVQSNRIEFKEREGAEMTFEDEIDYDCDTKLRERFGAYGQMKSIKSKVSRYLDAQNLKQKIFVLRNERYSIRRGVAEGGGWAAIEKNQFVFLVFDWKCEEGGPVVVSQQFQFEDKFSFNHFNLKCFQNLKSKEPYCVLYGFRQFNPVCIFSVPIKKSNKYRYLRETGVHGNAMMSFSGRINYPGDACLVFRGDSLVGCGNKEDLDPLKVILKKRIFTGNIHKCKKKSAVVKWMFFNKEDVLFYRSVDLFTKRKLKGKIKEPLGEKGVFKCVFDQVVSQQDVVAFSLYKRVFPPN